MQMYGKPYQQFQPHFAPFYTCGVYGHLSKNCPHLTFTQQNHSRNATTIATPSYQSRTNTTPLVFPQAFLPNNSP